MKRTYKIALVSFGGLLLLALVAAYIYFRAIGLKRVDFTKTGLDAIAKSSTDYHAAFGKWPRSLQDLSNANFVAGVPVDGWDRPFIYKSFDPVRGYGTITSYGRDGQTGGTGVNADFEVHFGK